MNAATDEEVEGAFDGLAALEKAAEKQEAEEKAAKRIDEAMFRLIGARDPGKVFFAQLALQLEPTPDWDIKRLATDGRHLSYNPQYAASMDEEELFTVVAAHLPLHCALGHTERQGHRDPEQFQDAADAEINWMLKEAGWKLAADEIVPGVGEYKDLPPNLTAEEYYDLLPERPGKPKGNGPGNGKGKGGAREPGQGPGEVQQSGDQAEQENNRCEWQTKVASAQDAAQKAAERGQQAGNMPAWLQQLVKAALAPKVDWRAQLIDFLVRRMKTDQSWNKLSRRHLARGLYLPGYDGEQIGKGIVYADVSGSCWDEKTVQRYASELQGVLDQFPCTLHIYYHDTEIQREQVWTPGDGPLVLDIQGGGGTSHHFIANHVKDMEEQPDFILLLSDLYTSDFGPDPEVPALWAAVNNKDPKPAWGKAIIVDD